MPGTIAIAAYRTKVLALLDDASQARYTSDQVDQAIRQALTDYSRAQPLEQTYIFDADGSRVFTLPADFRALYITALQDQATFPYTDYAIYAYNLAEQWIIETPHATIPSGTALTVLYAGSQQIDGLDSAAGTTIEDDAAEYFAAGAAGYALLARANSRTETVNITPDTPATLAILAAKFLNIFHTGIRGPFTRQTTAEWQLDTDKKF